MPIKLTWKSIVGLLAALAGALSASSVATFGLPTSVSNILILIGGFILAAERIADAIDNSVAAGTGATTAPTATPSLTPDPADVRAAGQAPQS